MKPDESKGERSKGQLSNSFTVVIRLFLTRFIKPNFHVLLSRPTLIATDQKGKGNKILCSYEDGRSKRCLQCSVHLIVYSM